MTRRGFWGPQPTAFPLIFFPDLSVVLAGKPISLFNVYAVDMYISMYTMYIFNVYPRPAAWCGLRSKVGDPSTAGCGLF